MGVSAPRLRVKNVLSCGLFEVSFAPYYGVEARVATGGTQQRGLKTSVLGRFQGVKRASWGRDFNSSADSTGFSGDRDAWAGLRSLL